MLKAAEKKDTTESQCSKRPDSPIKYKHAYRGGGAGRKTQEHVHMSHTHTHTHTHMHITHATYFL